MLPDIQGHDHYTATPSIDQIFHEIVTLLPKWILLPFLTLNYLIPGVSIEHLQRVWLANDAYSSGHLVLSHLGLAFVLMLRPLIPEVVMSTDLLSFEHSSDLFSACDYHFKSVTIKSVTTGQTYTTQTNHVSHFH